MLGRGAPQPPDHACVRFVSRESCFLAFTPLIPVAARNGNASAVPAAPDDPRIPRPRPRPHDQYQYRERTPRTPRTPPVRTLAVMRADPGALCPLLYTPSRGPLCSGTGAHSLGSARPGLGRFSPLPSHPIPIDTFPSLSHSSTLPLTYSAVSPRPNVFALILSTPQPTNPRTCARTSART